MCKISVVMAAYNAGKHITAAIESVLNQSFTDFEFIITDDGSTDNTLSVVRSFEDKRIRLIENKHDFIGSLNKGMSTANGKYIARMDADDIMHIDRLKIEFTIMEEEPEITVCSSWMTLFGKQINTPKKVVQQSISGIMNAPLIHLLKSNPIVNSSSMIRHEFIKKQAIQYEKYPYAEDYKWWVEMAKSGATFYIEPQPLVYYRISDTQVTYLHNEKMKETSTQIKWEIVDYLITINSPQYNYLRDLLTNLHKMRSDSLLSDDNIFEFIYRLFIQNTHFLKQNNE